MPTAFTASSFTCISASPISGVLCVESVKVCQKLRKRRFPWGKWCLFIPPLEPFFKDMCLEATRVEPFLPVPDPVPAGGQVLISNQLCLARVSSLFPPLSPSPNSVGFCPQGLAGCAWPIGHARQKPPSSLTRHTGSPTDGFTPKGQAMSFTVLDG